MVGPAGTQEFGVVSAEFDSERPDIIPTGESKSQPLAVGNGGVVPAVVFFEPASEGVDVEPRELHVPGGGGVANATVTLHAPPETGYYRWFVVQHRYLAVLPASVIESLYRLHPWVPILVVDALLGVPRARPGQGSRNRRSTVRSARLRVPLSRVWPAKLRLPRPVAVRRGDGLVRGS
jgi:signal peptidase